MKICLIQLPLISSNELTFPLGPLTLASYLIGSGHSPAIIDLDRLIKKGLMEYGSGFPKRAALYLYKLNPYILGFYVMCNEQLPLAILISKYFKELNPRSRVILGGPEMGAGGDALLRIFKHIDIIVRGEGELTVDQLLSALQKNTGLSAVRGITFRENQKIMHNPDRALIPDLDRLPLPRLSLLPYYKEYTNVFMEGGRGCPHHCVFCSASAFWKHTYRLKSPARIIKEMRLFYSVFKNSIDPAIGLSIIHDNFLAKRRSALKLLKRLKGINFRWNCAARFDVLNRDFIRSLKESGCRALEIGIESGSKRMQKLIGKNLRLEKLADIIPLLIKHGIQATFTFIIGLPGESLRDLNQTLTTALRCKLYRIPPAIFLPPFTVMKGSELYHMLEKQHVSKLPASDRFLLPQEISLINKYPRIFPPLHYLSHRAFNPYCVSQTYQFLADHYPITTLLILRILSLSPLDLFHRLAMLSAHTETALRSFIKHSIKSDLIRAVAEHESSFKAIRQIDIKAPKRKGPINLNSNPYLAPHINLKSIDYDINLITEHLKRNAPLPEEKSSHTLAYIPGSPPKVIPLKPAAMRLLALCNGRRSINDIITILYGPNSSTIDKTSILHAYGILQGNGLIIR